MRESLVVVLLVVVRTVCANYKCDAIRFVCCDLGLFVPTWMWLCGGSYYRREAEKAQRELDRGSKGEGGHGRVSSAHSIHPGFDFGSFQPLTEENMNAKYN
jgi:hypothetical protein